MSFYKEVPGRKTTLESTLKFDVAPTAGSTNPVTSDGISTAITEAVGGASEALQEQIDEIAEKAGSGYTPKGEASVATLNGLTGQENGWLYTMTDAGTLTDGSLAVTAGDSVAWDATNSVWYKAMDYAPRQYGTNEINNLPTTITAFRSGDYIAVGGTTPAKMSKDDLLKETAENALMDARKVAPDYIFGGRGTNPEDLNNLKDSAIYLVQRTASTATLNFPSDFGTDGKIAILEITKSSYESGDNKRTITQKLTILESGVYWYRRWSDTTSSWNEWGKVDRVNAREVARNYIYAERDTNPADLNDLKDNAIYLVQRNDLTETLNFPSDFGTDMKPSILKITTSKYGTLDISILVTQVLTKFDTNETWSRRWAYSLGHWTDWVHYKNNFESYVKEKTSEQKGFSDYLPSASWTSSQNEVIMTVKDSAVQKKSLISKIKIKVNKEGKYRFFTAVVDQNNYIANASAPFDLMLSAGVNEVNVLSLGLTIGEGATLFVYSDYWNNSSSSPKGVSYTLFTHSATYIDHEVIYTTSLDQPVHRFNTTGGGVICLSWDVVDVESAFAFREDLKNVADQARANAEAIEASKVIVGANGNLYTIGVDVNGNLVALALNFSNGLCIGNSLTDHAPSPEYGWYGDGFPMAASNSTTGWINELQEIFRQKNPSAVVGRIGGTTISAFERAPQDYVTDADFDAVMGSYVGANLDFIIYKAGENVAASNLANYKDGLKRFISYLKRKYTSAQLFISQPFYGQSDISNVTLEAATETYTQYIANGSSFRRQILGMFTYGDGDNIYPIISAPVAQHLCDDGFLTWANHLAERLGYQPLDWFKTITLSASGFDTLVNGSRGVKGGVYTILGKGIAPSSISMLDGSSNPVAYTLHDMTNVSWKSTPAYIPDWAITFIVPSTDVTVTLT